MEELVKEYESWTARYLEARDALTKLMQPGIETNKPQLTLAKIDYLHAEEQKAYNKRRALFEKILRLTEKQ